MKPALAAVLVVTFAHVSASQMVPPELSVDRADAFAGMAMAAIDREYPNKPGEVLTGPQDLKSPRAMHPAFYGSFDWHSSVHGHWLLVRLLKTFPGMTHAAEVRARLNEHLTGPNLLQETAYFDSRENRSFERMYGWAWALRLAAELKTWDDPDGRRWAASLAPLEQRLVALTRDYLPRLTYPVRTGVHPDTAFALGQVLDYARVATDRTLEELVTRRARDYYSNDSNYPLAFEPSGQDFFSPGLNVADLMRRVLSRDEFSDWLDRFAPELKTGRMGHWAAPAVVSDLSDPQIVHLVGLNLSRAWTMQGMLSAINRDSPRGAAIEKSMRAHATEGMKYVFSGHYEGEHWLATFAVYYLTRAGVGSVGE
jgi:hypothetical protein